MLQFLLLLLFSHSVISIPDFDLNFTKKALEFSATAYAEDQTACLAKLNATLSFRIRLPCDYIKDECWGLVLLYEDWIVVSFRGTRSKLQLITELVETMGEPKKKLHAGGSVQHYFYVALSQIWKPILITIRKLRALHPEYNILFTGHSLGGALASIASTVYADRHPMIRNRVHLITFGQPRVGNYEYATVHDNLLKSSWRIVHRYDIVPHLPACAVSLRSRACIRFFNHAPYHHGTEVWYPGNMTENALYSVCKGHPLNEDQQCSNGWVFHYDIRDHAYYFEHNVSEYGRNQCIDPVQ